MLWDRTNRHNWRMVDGETSLERGFRIEQERAALQQQLKAVKSIRREYANLIAQERGLIGADTVLDMIDAALAMGEK